MGSCLSRNAEDNADNALDVSYHPRISKMDHVAPNGKPAKGNDTKVPQERGEKKK
eukprot:CAMPEP_0172309610 /NCGR_PEP_ID=MMETSP1058-20130122/10261_1 /TAXON_ID=83371 /ORGANISM="Detonula confervacea, Strain CCMP 353" /LENGTH=54 /DNA_ID=CAMNT_0013022269 /DNA_START=148 /DNA_END=312 /DNA_ORIENTATION=-